MGAWRLTLFGCSLIFATTAEATDWTFKSEVNGIRIYNRPRPGSSALEIKAVAWIDAPAKVVWAVLRDYQGYKGENGMPFTKEASVLKQENDGKVTYFYSIVGVGPFLCDYNIRIVDESNWEDGRGFLRTSWTLWEGPFAEPPQWLVVRLSANEGYWQLDPTSDGIRTRATYQLFAVPPGILLDVLASWANAEGVPKLFQTIREKTKLPQYRGAQ